MALPTSGPLSLNQIHIEAGGTSGTTASINDADIRVLIGKASGATMSFSEWYGASSSTTINITISSNTNNYNLWNSKGGTYSAGNTTINVTINSGVTIGSTSTGTYAFDTGTGWSSGDVINITNNGTIKGRGGNGGAGGSVVYNSTTTQGSNGGTGGNAFRGQFACTVTNNGSVYGGGGGGGGGGATWSTGFKSNAALGFTQSGSGGGGGAGVTSSSGGGAGSASGGQNGNFTGAVGSGGTATAGGAGGANNATYNAGGFGGGLGANGNAGTKGFTVEPQSFNSSAGTGGVRGYYQVGSSFINGGSGISGTVGGRSA